MTIAAGLWLLVVGGALWALGCRYLLHCRQVQADHREHMARIAVERDRLTEDIQRSRAARASRTRPDLTMPAPAPDPVAVLDGPTEVMAPAAPPGADNTGPADPAVVVDAWPDDLDDGVVEQGTHRLPSTL